MRGFTLVELLVALTILGVTLGVSALALGSLRPPPSAEWPARATAARTQAVRSGAAVRIVGPSWGSRQDSVLFLPDGRALGRGAEPLTGQVGDVPR